MSLRDLQTNERGHAGFHNEERRRLNRLERHFGVLAEDYDSIQDALNAAALLGVKKVLLDSTKVYSVSSPIVVPDGITLDGGGGAVLRATTGLDPIVSLEKPYASLTGCVLNANNLAVAGVLIRAHKNRLTNCTLQNFDNTTDIAVKIGGALYTHLHNNIVGNNFGRALDCRFDYRANGAGAYGVVVGMSSENVWSGRAGGIHVEGNLTSVNDDFEYVVDANAVVEVGSSQYGGTLYMQTPYFELTKGNISAVTAFRVEGSLILWGGQFHGAGDTGSTFINAEGAYQLSVRAADFIRNFEYGLTGAVDNGCMIDIGGSRWSGGIAADKRNLLTNLDNAKVAQLSVL